MRGLYKYLRMKKICCIGHITLDKIITPKSEVEMPGGTSFYFAHGIHNLNPDANFQLVTAVAQSEMKSVDDIRALGVDVVVLPTRHTVFFENKYGENQNNRTQGYSPRPTRSRRSRFRE
jgi:sugar/nucleoside kinase (ribokinase family)